MADENKPNEQNPTPDDGGNQQPKNNGGEDKKFTQADIDRVVADRLSRQEKTLTDKIAGMYGMTPDEAKALKDAEAQRKADADKQEREALEKKGEYDKLIEKMKAEREATNKTHADKVAELEGQIQKFHVDRELREAATKAGVMPEYVDDVLSLTRSQFRLAKDGKIEVLDAKGELSAESVSDFFSKTFKEAKPLFYPAAPGGSGTKPGSGGGTDGKTITRTAFDAMDPKAQMDFAIGGGTVVDA